MPSKIVASLQSLGYDCAQCCSNAGKTQIHDLISSSRNYPNWQALYQKGSPFADYSLSLSLQFLAEYKKTNDPQRAASAVSEGADVACLELQSHYEKRCLERGQDRDHSIKRVVAQDITVQFDREIVLKRQVDTIIPYLQQNLASGAYLITLGTESRVLIKDQSQACFFYDPNVGLLNIAGNEKWLLKHLIENEVYWTENLSLLRVTESPGAVVFQKDEVVSDEIRDDGQIVVEQTVKTWGKIDFTWRGQTHEFVTDSRTNEVYNSDPKSLVRKKCAGLIVGTPLVALGRAVYSAVQAFFGFITLPLALVQGRLCSQMARVQRAAFDLFRAPIYGLLGTMCAIYGLFNPYEGRKLYGRLEVAYLRQEGRVERFSMKYLASCFVPINYNQQDKTDLYLLKAKLKKSILSAQFY